MCAALANLAFADENKYEIAKGGAVTPLIVRAQSEDMEVARQACGCLANLAEMPDNQIRIAEEGGVKPVIQVMRSPFVEVQREAGRCLANLAAHRANHRFIVDEGGHQLLISYLLSPDTASQRVGALGIGNLATNPKYRVMLVDAGCLEPLMSLCRSEEVRAAVLPCCRTRPSRPGAGLQPPSPPPQRPAPLVFLLASCSALGCRLCWLVHAHLLPPLHAPARVRFTPGLKSRARHGLRPTPSPLCRWKWKFSGMRCWPWPTWAPPWPTTTR